MTNCAICKIIHGELTPPGGILFQDDKVILHHNLDVNIFGYLLVSPIRHEKDFENLTDDEWVQMQAATRNAVQLLKKENPSIERFYISSFGELTPHVHFHIFPRYDWMLKDPDVYFEGELDAAKLFCHFRQKLKQYIDKANLEKIEAFKKTLKSKA